MYGKNWNWKYQKKLLPSGLNKRKMTKSVVMLIIILFVVTAAIFSSIYLVEMNRMKEYGDFSINEVTMDSFSSVSVSYQINAYDDEISYYFDGNIIINNWSIRWNGLLSKNGIVEIQSIPLSSVVPYFNLDTFDINIYGNYVEKMVFEYSISADLHYSKSFRPDISCSYHEFQYLDLVNITFSTTFRSPVLNVGGNVNISYNAMINVTDYEIDWGMLNMEEGFYSSGNVSIFRSFDNSFVVINATSTYDFNANVYDPPDALWTFVIAERLSHKLDGLPDSDPCVLITDFSIQCGGFIFNLPSWYVEVSIA